MLHVKNFIKKYKHFLSAFIFLFLILWFFYLKKTIIPKHIMKAHLDAKIPFVRQFVLAYYFWFAYMAIGLLYLGFVSKKDFYKMEIFLSLGMVISFIVFIFYPNAQFPRPTVKGNDIFSYMVNFIYNHDGTNNVFPSIHVCNALGVHICLINCEKLKEKKLVKKLSLVASLLICASTVFIKQHSIIDVIGGMILAGIIYLVIYQLPKLHREKERIAYEE